MQVMIYVGLDVHNDSIAISMAPSDAWRCGAERWPPGAMGTETLPQRRSHERFTAGRRKPSAGAGLLL